MATIDIEIASRRYAVACRDGDEEHLRSLATLVDRRAHDAAEALGTLSETRQLLFASLLLADDLKTKRPGDSGSAAQAAQEAGADPAVADALERLAERVEILAESLERAAGNP